MNREQRRAQARLSRTCRHPRAYSKQVGQTPDEWGRKPVYRRVCPDCGNSTSAPGA